MSDWMDKIPEQSNKSTLAELASYCRELKNARQEIEKLSTLLETEKKKAEKLAKEIIPDFMSANGLTLVKLETGEVVEVVEDITVSLPKTDQIKRLEALRYISSLNGGSAIIKEVLTIPEATKGIKDLLEATGCSFEETRDIHHASLKAFFKGLLGYKKNTPASIELSSIPKELSLYVYRDTKIK